MQGPRLLSDNSNLFEAVMCTKLASHRANLEMH